MQRRSWARWRNPWSRGQERTVRDAFERQQVTVLEIKSQLHRSRKRRNGPVPGSRRGVAGRTRSDEVQYDPGVFGLPTQRVAETVTIRC